MNEKFAVLRLHLSELVFAQVTNTVAKEEHLISFSKDRITYWKDEPDFAGTWKSMGPGQRRGSEASYDFYFGFAQSILGDIHFDSKGHRYNNNDFTGLGIITPQCALEPPTRCSWIVGCIDKTRADHVSRPHFHCWARCTEAEKLFAEHLSRGRTKFGEEELKRLFVGRHQHKEEGSNRLINMALLLLAGDLDYFLRHRQKHGGEWIDPQVFEVCEDFDTNLWEKYKELALTQRTYSTLIPEPAPQPIKELRADAADSDLVGLSTPFTRLEL